MTVYIPFGYGQATLRFACVGIVDPMLVTFGFKTAGDFETDPNTTALELGNQVTGAGKVLDQSTFSNEYTFTGVDVQLGNGENDPQIGGAAFNVSGTSQINTPPCNSAILVKKRSAFGGRRNRGRFFFPPDVPR